MNLFKFSRAFFSLSRWLVRWVVVSACSRWERSRRGAGQVISWHCSSAVVLGLVAGELPSQRHFSLSSSFIWQLRQKNHNKIRGFVVSEIEDGSLLNDERDTGWGPKWSSGPFENHPTEFSQSCGESGGTCPGRWRCLRKRISGKTLQNQRQFLRFHSFSTFQALKSLSDSLKTQPEYSCSEGEQEVNRKKNRYKDILPCKSGYS